MKQVEVNCEICYDNNISEMVKLNCKHELCSRCFLISVVPKEICPFCKQTVTEVQQRDKIISIKTFEKPKVEEDFFEDAHFDLVNENFFHDDLVVLNQNLERAYKIMGKQVKQVDYLFNAKWFIYEQIECEIQTLEFKDPVQTFQQIQNLNIQLQCIMNNNWNNHLFENYHEMYNLGVENNHYENQFVMKEKRNKRQKNKNKKKHNNKQQIQEEALIN